MGRRYKLRLGDGTLLRVDQDGLNTWRQDPRAMVQAAGGRWRPLKELLAMQDAAAKHASLQDPVAHVPPAPLVPPRPQAPSTVPPKPFHQDDAAHLLDAFSPSDAPALAVGEPPDLGPVPDEPAIFSADAPSHPSPPEEEVVAILPQEDEPAEPAADSPPWSEPVEPSPITARPALQALADDPAPRYGYEAEASEPDPLPSIRLKASDDRAEAYAPAPRGPQIYDREEDDFLPARPRGASLEEQFVRAVRDLAGFLGRLPELLDRAYRQLQPTFRDGLAGVRQALAARRAARSSPRAPEEPRPSVDEEPELLVVADEPSGLRAEDTGRRAMADEEVPIIRLKPQDGEGGPLHALSNLLRRLGAWVSTRVVDVKGRVDRLGRGYRARPSGPSAEGPSAEPAPWKAVDAVRPAPRDPLQRPPTISELPVLRLAKIDEPEEEHHLFEGEYESPLRAGWLWTKRLVLMAALVAGGLVAARTWETWFPKAAQLGGVAVTETGKYIESREQKERERRALQQATAQLPHLAPDTIRLVLSQSSTGALDPPGVFQAACDAADRGLSALTPGEAEELMALRSALIDTLSPAEGERVREYDEVRSRRIPFDFEDRTALELFARGARALPPESRARLQELLGKAIAAGLTRQPESAPGAVANR